MTITSASEITEYMFNNASDSIPASFKMMFDCAIKGESMTFIESLKKEISENFVDRQKLRTIEGYNEYVSIITNKVGLKLITHDAITGKEGDVYFTK